MNEILYIWALKKYALLAQIEQIKIHNFKNK
jgi:hypothetical protein